MATPDADKSVWSESFSETTQQEQMDDDAAAWRAVTGLLLTIISVGVLLALFTVWVVT